MENKLSQEELRFIEEGISFYKTSGAKIFLLISLIFPLLLYLILGLAIKGMVLLMGGLVLISFYIWYSLFGQPNAKLKKDFDKGIKIAETATINKIMKNKNGNIYLMSNGLKIKKVTLTVRMPY